MRVGEPGYLHLIAVMRQVHSELQELKKLVVELQDDLSTIDRQPNVFEALLGAANNMESESESEADSVQSAPATVSYELEDEA